MTTECNNQEPTIFTDCGQPIAPKLAHKILCVISKIGSVAKDGENSFHKYRYASESAIMEAIRPCLIEHGLAVLTSLESYKVDSVPGKNKDECRVTMTYLHTIMDQDDGKSIVVRSFGQGIDAGDKAGYKAATGAMKYFLSKNFMVSFSDDPEGTGHEEERGRYSEPPARQERAPRREEPRQEEESPREAVMDKGGKTPMGRPATVDEAKKVQTIIDLKNEVLGDLAVDIQKYDLSVKEVLDHLKNKNIISKDVEDLADMPVQIFESMKVQYTAKIVPMLQRLADAKKSK